jgi:hypothetical protein
MPVLDGSARPADLARALGALSIAGGLIGLVAAAHGELAI